MKEALKEGLIIIKIGVALLKELRYKSKLLEHRNKMLDMYKEYANSEIQHKETLEWVLKLGKTLEEWMGEYRNAR